MLVATGEAYIRGRIEGGQNPFSGTLYLGCSTDGTVPASGDTGMAGEQTANGLGRQAVTAAHTTGTNTWTFGATFTYTASTPNNPVNIVKIMLWDAASGGNLITEDIVPQVSFSQNGDSCPFNVILKV